MSPRLNRVWLLLPFLLLALQAWALGLGDIRLSSALNEPLTAEIELLAATPEELNNLTVQLASQETFQRYDLDRPMYLTSLQFDIVRSGTADGNVIRVTSTQPITEPFITFLVEASWSRGRLLREYTVLLDPPTFAPPPSTPATESVTAPTRTAPADSGQIQRPAPQQQPAAPPPSRPPVRPPSQVVEPEPAPAPAPFEPEPEPEPEPPAQVEPTAPAAPPAQVDPDAGFGQPTFDTASGGDVLVVRGDTLWGITQRVRPDSRLTINQTMLAIFEANPEAFDGNINRLRAGATLRIPSADDVFRISRASAYSEVLRQNQEWRGETPAPAAVPDPEPPAVADEPVLDPIETQPSLTLVPPDEDLTLTPEDTGVDTGAEAPVDDAIADTGEEPAADPVDARIAEIEAILDDPSALIAIEDNELAALRQELANLRGEELLLEEAPPAEDPVAEEPVEDAPPVVTTAPPVVSQPARDEGIVDTILGYLNNFWVWIGSALVITVAILVWFMRRAARRDDEEATGVWDALGPDDLSDAEEMASTERLRALARDDEESIVVVETQADLSPDLDALSDTMEVPPTEEPAPEPATAEMPDVFEMSDSQETREIPAPETAGEEADVDLLAATGSQPSLEDTFSSETAVNLDQSDPIAEADFHMAYGLYDQAADLINGALTADPEQQDLLAKLCEIYFVWGNRDAFIDAAQRTRALAGDDSQAEWDKIVIMGQQIAADHELFSGVSAEGVTKAVDLSFEGGMEDAGDLDMDFAGTADADADSSDVIDLGGDDDEDVIDFGGTVAEEVVADETGQVLIPPDSGSGIDFSLDDDASDLEASATREMPEPSGDETTEMPLDDDDTSELAQDDSVRTPTIEEQFDMEATGELAAMSEPEAPATPPTDATAEIDLDDLGLDLEALEETAMAADIEADADLGDFEDTATSEQLEISDELAETGKNEALDDADALAATGKHEALADEDTESTGTREALDIDTVIADDATSLNEALSESDATGIAEALSDDAATGMASLDDDGGEDTDVDLDTSLLDATGQTQVLTEDMAVETGTSIEADLADSDATLLASDSEAEEPESALSDDAATLLAPMDEDEEEGEFDFAKTEALPKDVFSPDMSTDDTGRMPGLAGSTDMDLDLDDLTAALKVSEVGDTINQVRDDATVEQPRLRPASDADDSTQSLSADDMSEDLHEARTMTEVGTKLDLARAYVDMGDPAGARSILEEVLDEGDDAQKQQAQHLIDSLPS